MQWFVTYYVQFSQDGTNFIYVMNGYNKVLFNGNIGQTDVKKNLLVRVCYMPFPN